MVYVYNTVYILIYRIYRHADKRDEIYERRPLPPSINVYIHYDNNVNS